MSALACLYKGDSDVTLWYPPIEVEASSLVIFSGIISIYFGCSFIVANALHQKFLIENDEET